MRALLLVLATSLLSGCFVFDELDQGEAIMDAHRPAAVKEAQAASSKQTGGKEDGPSSSAVWWSKARTFSKTSQDEADPNRMVRCTRGGSSNFMQRSDCLAQGGSPSAL